MRTRSLEELFSQTEWHQAEREKFEQAAGWRYGLLFGIAFVLVGWGWDAYELWSAHAELFWLKLVLIAIVILPLTILAGVLTGRILNQRTRKFIPWVVVSASYGFLCLWLSFEGVNLAATLLDPTLGYYKIFPFSPAVQERIVGMALFSIVIGILAAGLQSVTTAWAWDRSSTSNQFTLASWRALVPGIVLALALGALFDGAANSQIRAPYQITHRLIQLALTMPPNVDYQQMGTQMIIRYGIVAPWRNNFTPNYTIRILDLDNRTIHSAFVDATFDNGFTWRCTSVRDGESLIDCVDLRAQYNQWMQQFVRTGVIHCDTCMVSIAPSASIWYMQNANSLGEPKQIGFVHHTGGIVTMRADLVNSSVDCRFVGANPTQIYDCVRP